MNSLDAKGKQILAELEGKPIGGRRRKPLPYPGPIDATLTSNGNTQGGVVMQKGAVSPTAI